MEREQDPVECKSKDAHPRSQAPSVDQYRHAACRTVKRKAASKSHVGLCSRCPVMRSLRSYRERMHDVSLQYRLQDIRGSIGITEPVAVNLKPLNSYLCPLRCVCVCVCVCAHSTQGCSTSPGVDTSETTTSGDTPEPEACKIDWTCLAPAGFATLTCCALPVSSMLML